MPKPPTPVLCWSEESQIYELTENQHPVRHLGSEDRSAWLDFLKTHTSFSFQGREGRLSVIKETRPRGTGYWYAYRSSGRRTAKRYLGKTDEITFARLEGLAESLNHTNNDKRSTPIQKEAEPSSTPPSLQASLLLPRLRPPRLPSSLVERPRLLQQLNLSQERKLTLLVAPAGFGKTTLIGQWRQMRQEKDPSRPIAWVSLESADNDLVRFWRSIITACQILQPYPGLAALAQLSEAQKPPFASPPQEAFLTSFLNDLAQQSEGGTLILDDYHAIEEPRIHEGMIFFLDHLPTTFNVLLATRTEPLQLPLLRWRARGELTELHAAELRFSSEETTIFLRQALPAPLSDAALKQLNTSLQGWIAGLRLFTLARPGQITSSMVERVLASPEQFSDPSSPYQPLLEYFVMEILNDQPEPLQRFLLQTSVLNRLNGSLCQTVTGEENSTTQLATIEQSGLFLEALDDMGGWYRFHTLFAEALRREALRRLGEEVLRALSLRASHWFEEHALGEEAIEAALRAHDFDRAARLIEYLGTEGQFNELYSLRRWFLQIPEEILPSHPTLCWLAALALQILQQEGASSTATRERVEILLHIAEEGWLRQGDPTRHALIAIFHALSAWKAGQFSDALEYARQALAQVSDEDDDYHIQGFRGLCLFIVGVAFLSEGKPAEARSILLQGYRYSLANTNRHFTLSMLLLVGVCSYILGELHLAHEHYQQVLADAREQGDREVIAQTSLCLAHISYEWNDLARVEQLIKEAQAVAPEENEDIRYNIAHQLALLAFARGDITSAQQQVATLLARLQLATALEAGGKIPDILLISARLSLEAGDLQMAAHILESPLLQNNPAVQIFEARLILAQGKPREAMHQLEQLHSTDQEWRHTFEIELLLTLAHAACQEIPQARKWLEQVLTRTRTEGFMRFFLSEGEPLARVLRQLLPGMQEPALRSYARTILRAFTTSSEESIPGSGVTTSITRLIEPLSPQERRVLQLLASGQSNQEIARELVVSINTVKDHVKHLYRKLGVNNRLQASQAAHELKLL